MDASPPVRAVYMVIEALKLPEVKYVETDLLNDDHLKDDFLKAELGEQEKDLLLWAEVVVPHCAYPATPAEHQPYKAPSMGSLTMVLTLYKIDASPPVRSVFMAIEALDLENVQMVDVNLFEGEHLREEYLKVNPQHTVPMLADNDFYIWDSHAIVTYLVTKYGKNDDLYPADPEKRAIIDQRLHFDSGILFPSLRAWKKVHVLPLPKVSNPSSLSEFRPISILPIPSQVLESVVNSQLSHYLSSNRLLSPYQSGFRPGHCTVSALVKITDDIRLAIENRLLTIMVLLDFSSAFNSVDFDILLGILSSLNVSPSATAWFNSYLRGRSQSVRSDDVSSDWCDLSAADDLQLYQHCKLEELPKAIDAINNDLGNISKWAKSFGLLANPTKSQALIVGGRYFLNKLQSPPPVLYDNVAISYTTYVKNLGVLMDCHLSWGLHIAESLLLPLLDYADVCFLDATEELLDKLERLQNLCIRFIFGLRKYDHVSEFRSRLKWLPI
ncbi:unnamed protein product [Spodoptera exigua]|nr:unnamed protein product [Spodoptera exigua]